MKWNEVDTQFESEIQTYKKMFNNVTIEKKSDTMNELVSARSLPNRVDQLENRWMLFERELVDIKDYINKKHLEITKLIRLW